MINYRDELVKEFTEEESTQIMLDLIDYIELKKEGSISDYILDFCNLYEYRIEEIAYLIKDHSIFKNILKQDCIFHGIFRNKKKIDKIDKW